MEGSDDIFVHKFSISMGGKTLFKDSKLVLAHGRRYGLIGACFWLSHAAAAARSRSCALARRQVRTAAVRVR